MVETMGGHGHVTAINPEVVPHPMSGVVLVVITGRDVGELGDAPFQELQKEIEAGPFDLFIDARATSGGSVAVSGEWAAWLQQHSAQLRSIHMLTGSKFIQLTADFVRRFAQLGELMRIYTDARAFEEALAVVKARVVQA